MWWTYWHEPEDDIERGAFSAGEYRAAWRHLEALAEQAHSRRLRSTLVLMCWTLADASGRHWRDYYAGDRIIDAPGRDCYNTAVDKGHYRDPAKMFTRATTVAAAVQKPWGIAELGIRLVKGDDGTRRARWLRDCAAWLRDAGASWASYFDAPVGAEFRLFDKASRAAWRDAVGGS